MADQLGIPETRSEYATSFGVNRRRPLRWPMTRPSRAAVKMIAPTVAMITCPIAAPAAGLAAARAGAGDASRIAIGTRTAVALFTGLGICGLSSLARS